MEEASKALTAFTVGPLGFYECDRMPFGLSNAPATFQRLMESCLGNLHLNWCIIYLDDVVVFSKTPEDHLARLRRVFLKLREAGLKLKPSKCELFKERLNFLGHVVSKEGVETDPTKTEEVRSWPTPTTVTEVRSFLGFANHYRRFLKGYAKLAKPLNGLISGENAKRKQNKVEWNEESEKAFQEIKDLVTRAPVLAYADYTKPFKLNTDASGLGLGAALYQADLDGHDRPVAYASRSLSKSEQNYPAHKLEFLALKWAVTDQFHEYLYGNKFDVWTDNNPLTYAFTTAKLDATGHRWVAALANYNFALHYKKGTLNNDADALSRIDWQRLPVETVQCLMKTSTRDMTAIEAYGALEALSLKSVTLQVKDGVEPTHDWVAEQNKDLALAKVKQLLKDKELGTRKTLVTDSAEFKELLKQKTRLKLRNNLLYREVQRKKEEGDIFQFLVPKAHRVRAMKGCHDDVGHMGIQRCQDLLRDRFYWPHMAADMALHIGTCDRCQRFKGKQETAPMVSQKATHPLELVHIDYLTIKEGEGDMRRTTNILVVTDHFTRLAQAYVTPNQTAATTAKCLWENYFSSYGLPEKLLSDQGRNFESAIIKHLCVLAQARKIRTTPYHPQTNGQCERFNHTLINMIGTLDPPQKARWRQHLSALAHAYNCTRCAVTGYSPYELMFGRKPRLPVDIDFGTTLQSAKDLDHPTYMKSLEKRLCWAFKAAEKADKLAQEKAKKRYDRVKRVRAVKLEPGDVVLLRAQATSKIQDRWETATYVVISRPYPELPVYQIQEQSGGKLRTVHRNLLFPLRQGDGDESEEGSRPVLAQSPEETMTQKRDVEVISSDDSDSNVGTVQVPQGAITRGRSRKLQQQAIRVSWFKQVTEAVTSWWGNGSN